MFYSEPALGMGEISPRPVLLCNMAVFCNHFYKTCHQLMRQYVINNQQQRSWTMHMQTETVWSLCYIALMSAIKLKTFSKSNYLSAPTLAIISALGLSRVN